MKFFFLQYRYWPLPIMIWSLVVLASLLWNQAQVDHKILHLASDRAQFVFKMVEAARLWNAGHGGLYAPITDNSQPNPYLKVPERDISTPSGTRLTMINPAYMTRQLANIVENLTDLNLRLTSLMPLNPDNEPDTWERTQLEKFNHGAGQIYEKIDQGKNSRFRFMAPLKVEQPCLKCHEHQGYRLGDIRGGLSVSFMLDSLLAVEAGQLRSIYLTHLIVWLLLSVLTLFALAHFRRQMLALESAKAQTEDLVKTRTAELCDEVAERQQAEAQLRLFIDSSGEGIIGIDRTGLCTLVNPKSLQLLGLSRSEELLGQLLHARIHSDHNDGRVHTVDNCPLHDTLRSGAVVHDDSDVFTRADGSLFPVEYRSHPLYSNEQLSGAVITFSDITMRKTREQSIWRQAYFDSLTGVANRKMFGLRLEQAMQQAKQENSQFALLYVDMDGFKQVNDTLGHASGDELLHEVAQRLLDCLRDSDTVARLGGDEFALIVMHVHDSSNDVQVVAQKILQVLAQPYQLQGGKVILSASLGIAFYPADSRNADELLQQADEAMYRAKQAGRNGYQLYRSAD